MAIETLLVTSTSQEWGFENATDILMVKNGNLTQLPLSTEHKWQFHIANDIWW